MLKVKKNADKAWVTFTYIPANEEKTVEITGSWSNWSKEKMKQKKNGDFYITKILPVGQIYEFKYLIDDSIWENEADALEVQNSFGSVNSAIEV